MLVKTLKHDTIYLNDYHAFDAYKSDITEIFAWMEELRLPKNPTIFDVGANVGVFSLAYACMFPGAAIHAFEPISFIYDGLVKNLIINEHLDANFFPHNLGMSNRSEELQLSIPIAQQHERYISEESRIKPDTRLYSIWGHGDNKEKADFVAMDHWTLNNKIKSVDFIKIDVEGHEYPVLEGATRVLKNLRPIVMFELNQLTLALSGTNKEKYLKFAKEHDYDVYGLQYGFKRDLLRIDTVEKIDFVSDLILKPR